MPVEIINPSSEKEWLEMRTKDVTSSEVSALFGCCPYMTAYELWHRKKNGQVVTLEENEDMEWGKALEKAIAERVAVKEGWTIRPMKEYMRDPELRIGSSFDFHASGGNGAAPDPARILEIKNVGQFRFKDDWIIHEDKTIEAPPHIEFQVQHQMLVSGIHQATIAALIGGSRPKLLHRTLDPKVAEAIKRKVAAFWQSVDANVEPAPDFERDAEFIFDLHGRATEGKVMNVHGEPVFQEMAVEFDRLGFEIREAEKKKDALKAKLLMAIGDTEKVQGDGWGISAGMVAGGPVSYVRKDYRNFRLTFKKAKS